MKILLLLTFLIFTTQSYAIELKCQGQLDNDVSRLADAYKQSQNAFLDGHISPEYFETTLDLYQSAVKSTILSCQYKEKKSKYGEIEKEVLKQFYMEGLII